MQVETILFASLETHTHNELFRKLHKNLPLKKGIKTRHNNLFATQLILFKKKERDFELGTERRGCKAQSASPRAYHVFLTCLITFYRRGVNCGLGWLA